MKILSKYKDYYDYLSGIYGEDPKLVLDRRDSEPFLLMENWRVVLVIADRIIEGLHKDGKFYWGEDLIPFKYKKEPRRDFYLLSRHRERDYEKSIRIDPGPGHEHFWCYQEPYLDPGKPNTKNGIPIMIKTNYGYKRYPMLKDFNIAKFLPPETIYGWLSEWLSNQITEREKTPENVPDGLKIENKGFDKKRSFRPKMK